MNAISLPRRPSEKGTAIDASAFNDVGDCIKSWGMRGILSGGLFGFALGVVFVAVPLSTDVLSFGPIGTLLIGTVECAAVAGGFGALAAALYGKGRRLGDSVQLEPTHTANRLSEKSNRRDEEASTFEWPARWAYPGPTIMPSTSRAAGNNWRAAEVLSQAVRSSSGQNLD